jgi:hypothetical protein
MINPSSPSEVRAFFRDAWAAAQAGRPLTPLQDMVVGIVAMHPELHTLLEDPALLERDDPHTSAVFLHLSLHVAVREAVAADRPPGARAVHAALLAKGLDLLAVEHAMLEALHAELEGAARAQRAPDARALMSAWRQLA